MRQWLDSCIGPVTLVMQLCTLQAPKGCCFNYWTEDANTEHGVTNLTNASPDNDANDYVASALVAFIEGQAAKNAPFMAQVSFHNCHIPFIGTPAERARCSNNESCLPPTGSDTASGRAGGAYSSSELDFYACLNEFDEGVGSIIATLKRLDYYDNTMIWFTTDNGSVPPLSSPPSCTFFKMTPKNLDLRCGLHPAPAVVVGATRLESSIRKFKSHFIYVAHLRTLSRRRVIK